MLQVLSKPTLVRQAATIVHLELTLSSEQQNAIRVQLVTTAQALVKYPESVLLDLFLKTVTLIVRTAQTDTCAREELANLTLALSVELLPLANVLRECIVAHLEQIKIMLS